MSLVHLDQGDPGYPAALTRYLGAEAPARLTAWGNLDVLRQPALALFCSVRCPGQLILRTYDLAQGWRQAGVTVIGGFHSPMERECLTLLLRGTQPVIVCPARGLEGMRLPAAYQGPLAQGRLLLLSPFAGQQRRATVAMASYRNQVVAALAARIVVAHAEPASKTEQFCRAVLAWGKPLSTLDAQANANLLALGARLLET